jgi:hypothetical protein
MRVSGRGTAAEDEVVLTIGVQRPDRASECMQVSVSPHLPQPPRGAHVGPPSPLPSPGGVGLLVSLAPDPSPWQSLCNFEKRTIKGSALNSHPNTPGVLTPCLLVQLS